MSVDPQRAANILKASRKADIPALTAALRDPSALPSAALNGIRTRADETVLHLSVTASVADAASLAATQLLLDSGADATQRGHFNQRKTPLHEAARLGRAPLVRLLLSHPACTDVRVDAVKSGDWTPLHLAAHHAHPSCIDVLLRHGASHAARNRHAVTPLLLAARASDLLCVNAILDAGADVRCVCKNRRAPLHYAARGGDVAVIAALLAAGACPETRDAAGMLAAHDAVIAAVSAEVEPEGDDTGVSATNRMAVVQTLLEVTPLQALQTPDCAGQGLLHHAARDGGKRVAAFLLAWVAQRLDHVAQTVAHMRDARDARGFTPVALAMLNGRADVVALLVAEGAHVEEKCIDQCRQLGKDEAVRVALHALTKSEMKCGESETSPLCETRNR